MCYYNLKLPLAESVIYTNYYPLLRIKGTQHCHHTHSLINNDKIIVSGVVFFFYLFYKRLILIIEI